MQNYGNSMANSYDRVAGIYNNQANMWGQAAGGFANLAGNFAGVAMAGKNSSGGGTPAPFTPANNDPYWQ